MPYSPAYGIYIVDFFASQHDRSAGLGPPFLYFDGHRMVVSSTPVCQARAPRAMSCGDPYRGR